MSPVRRTPFLASFRHAWDGVWFAIRTQRNFRVHLAAMAGVVLVGAWLGVSAGGWALLVVTISAVLVAELINTAAEVMVDLVSPDYHPLAKQVKDLAAAGVLVVALAALLVGLLILGPPLWSRLSGFLWGT